MSWDLLLSPLVGAGIYLLAGGRSIVWLLVAAIVCELVYVMFLLAAMGLIDYIEERR